MQTLKQAIHLATTGKSRALRSAALELDGKPVGGWPETQQALRQIDDALPLRSEREYASDEFIAAMYTVDSADRYRANIWLKEQRLADAAAEAQRATRETAAKTALAAVPPLTIGTTRVELDSDGYVVQYGPALTAEELGAAIPADWLAAAKRARAAVVEASA
jgi:hypothetical protein